MLSSADLRRLLVGFAVLAAGAIASAQEPAPTWRSRYHPRGIAGALLLCGADVSPQETAAALRELRPDAPVSIAVIGGGESIGPLAAAASHCSPVGELRWGRTASEITPPAAPPKDLTMWVHAEPGAELGGLTDSPLGRTVLRHVSSGGMLVLSGAAAGSPWWTPDNGADESAVGSDAAGQHNVDSLLPGVALLPGDGVEEGDDVVPSPPRDWSA